MTRDTYIKKGAGVTRNGGGVGTFLPRRCAAELIDVPMAHQADVASQEEPRGGDHDASESGGGKRTGAGRSGQARK